MAACTAAGPIAIVVLVAGYAALWFAARPAGQPAVSYTGQFLGAEAVLLLSIGLVLISTLPWVETWFDGIDRAAIWHRRVALSGVILLIPHFLLSANPNKTGLGVALSVVGVAGLFILAAWAILPRWRSLNAPGIHRLRLMAGGYERWRSFHLTVPKTCATWANISRGAVALTVPDGQASFGRGMIFGLWA